MPDFSDSGTTRTCIACKRTVPLSEVYQKGTTRLGLPRYDAFCKGCRGEKTKQYRLAHEDQVKARKRAWYEERGRKAVRDLAYRRNYNSTQLAYDLQFQSQNGRCALCLREPAKGERCFAFDHDHETGLTRGVLCSACNGGLGCFRDRPEVLQRAIAYLQSWQKQHMGAEVA